MVHLPPNGTMSKGQKPMQGKPKLLQPPQGANLFNEWLDSERARHVLIVAALRPHPYLNILSRFGQKKSYGAWQMDTKVRLRLAIPKSFKPFDKAPLSIVAGFGMKPQVAPGGTRSVSIQHVDTTNLLKAIEDVCNGILWSDDKLVRSQVTVAVDDKADWWSLYICGAMRQWVDLPEAEVGPSVADWLA